MYSLIRQYILLYNKIGKFLLCDISYQNGESVAANATVAVYATLRNSVLFQYGM